MHELWRDGLGAAPVSAHGLPGRGGKNEGKFRPGHRSVEREQETRSRAAAAGRLKARPSTLAPGAALVRLPALPGRQAPRPGQAQAGGRVEPPRKPPLVLQAPPRGGHPIELPGRGGRPGAPQPKQQPQPKQPPKPEPQRRPQPRPKLELVHKAPQVRAPLRGVLAGLFGFEGLGDASADATTDQAYQPNAAVWVATKDVPVFLLGADGTRNGGAALLYPDGSQVLAQYALPAVDMSSWFDPSDLGSTVLADVWQAAWNAPPGPDRTDGQAAWLDSPDAAEAFGERGWEYVIDPTCSPPHLAPQLVRMDFSHHSNWSETLNHACQSWDSPLGQTLDRPRFGCTFNWSTRDPSSQAYAWVWLTLFPDEGVGWVQMPADIWRADGQTISAAGPPTKLGGRQWWNLHVLSALYSDDPSINHGMPRLISDSGQLDVARLAQWIAQPQNAAWARELAIPPAMMLATIYDAGAPELRTGFSSPSPSPSSSQPPTSVPQQPSAYDANTGEGAEGPPPSSSPATSLSPYDANAGGGAALPSATALPAGVGVGFPTMPLPDAPGAYSAADYAYAGTDYAGAGYSEEEYSEEEEGEDGEEEGGEEEGEDGEEEEGPPW